MINKFSPADKELISCSKTYTKNFDEYDYETKMYIFKYINLSYWNFTDLSKKDRDLFLQVNLWVNYNYNEYFNFITRLDYPEFLEKAKPLLKQMTQEESDCFNYKGYFDFFLNATANFFNENQELKEKLLNKFYNEYGTLDDFVKFLISFSNRGTPTECRQIGGNYNLLCMNKILAVLRFVDWNVSDKVLNDIIYTHFVFDTNQYVNKDEELEEFEKIKIVNAFEDIKQLKDVTVVKYLLYWLRNQISPEQEETLIRKLFYKTAFKNFYGDIESFLDSLTITHEKNKILFNNWRFTKYLNL